MRTFDINLRNIDLRKIQLFLQIADQSSFTKAASALNMSVPAVSKQITQLEYFIGTKLFVRSTKATKLTENGQHCYNFFKSLYDNYEKFMSSRGNIFKMPEPKKPVAIW